MASITVTCFLLTVVASRPSVIRGLEAPRINVDEFPTSTGGFLTGTDNHSDFGGEDVDALGANHISKMSRAMENHLLRMLKLSARPPAGISEATVPGYVRALQLAVDSMPLSDVMSDSADHFTWAIKAVQGIFLEKSF